MKGTSVECRVRYAETDQMGVVYHANYLVWCEMARTQLIRERGPTYAELEADGVMLAVADVSVRYQSPARYDDLIRTETWIQELRSRTVTFGYRILRVDAEGETEQLATATTRLICLDSSSRPRKLPLDVYQMLETGLQPET